MTVCGIFAFRGDKVDLAHLRLVATGAARRGPHGHGWTARYRNGIGQDHHALGPLDPKLPTLPTDPVAVLGHARLATASIEDDEASLQPYTIGYHSLVHNGVVHNRGSFPTSAVDCDLAAVTDSHQLAMGYAAARTDVDPQTALKYLAERAQQKAWVIVVLDADGHLYGHRYGHPLYQCLFTRGGAYWSSQPCCAQARMLPELSVFTTGGLT